VEVYIVRALCFSHFSCCMNGDNGRAIWKHRTVGVFTTKKAALSAGRKAWATNDAEAKKKMGNARRGLGFPGVLGKRWFIEKTVFVPE